MFTELLRFRGEGGFMVLARDLDGDGDPDVATAHSGSVQVRLNLSTHPASPDCNRNLTPDECEIASGAASDCNQNGIPDECDIASGRSRDQPQNNIPDECESGPFHRGDPNGDGVMDISDGLCALRFLFEGGVKLSCLDSADANDDGMIDCSDALFIIGYLFLATSPPPEPGPPSSPCGMDPDPRGSSGHLGCDSYERC